MEPKSTPENLMLSPEVTALAALLDKAMASDPSIRESIEYALEAARTAFVEPGGDTLPPSAITVTDTTSVHPVR
jgi:hypothetical protein